MATHEVHQDYIHDSTSSINDVKKPDPAEYVEAPVAVGREPPPYVKSLGPEDRKHAERALVRKIDLRLLPMIILM
jgi:hypothetical protein